MSTPTLPPVFRFERDQLSPQAQAEITALSGPRPAQFLITVSAAWIVIAVTIALAVHIGQWWFSVIAILVVATRQNVLALLLHEQTHLSAFRSKYGDTIVNLTCAYPMLVASVEGYAAVHLAHHRGYFTRDDPDFLRKSGPEWTFPKSKLALAKLFVSDLLMLNTIKLIKNKNAKPASGTPIVRRHPTPKWIRPAFLVALFAFITATGSWLSFLLYWVLPLVCVLPAIVRWGAICEHEYNCEGSGVATTTPLYIQGFLERLLLPNLNFGFHAYHHWYPGVSYSNLPKVHAIFVREGFINESGIFRGASHYLSFITRRLG